jgi:UTP--glucose-1-phosphate uridylyltransferase
MTHTGNHMTMPIRKAVFPVAGMGTRFLPATKANPKEMLPIVDKPLIQYAVEEATRAGIKELIFVTSSSKRAIEDHFDPNFELEERLKKGGKQNLLDIVSDILPQGISCAYIRQPDAFGLGHAVLCAKALVGNEPFAVLLADDLIETTGASCLAQMLEVYQEKQSSIVAVQVVEPDQSHLYGIVGFEGLLETVKSITQIVEKPSAQASPSCSGVVGRYILTPAIFACLEKLKFGGEQEMQLTDAIHDLLQTDPVYAFQFKGTRHDCGSKLGYLKATISHALKHPEVSDHFRVYLKGMMEYL